jgi:hypothetical protein
MVKIRDIPFRIPDNWSASWFRQYHVEVVAKGDYNTQTFLTIDDVNGVVVAHNADPFAHPDVINAHKAEANPHSQYVLEAPIDGQQYVRMNGAWVIVTAPGTTIDNILLEDGANLLLADGSLLLLTGTPADYVNNILLADGFNLLIEDGSFLLLEPPAVYMETLLEDGTTLLFEDDLLVLLEEP